MTQSSAETLDAIRRAARILNIDEHVVREHPMVLVGTPDDIVDTLQEREDALGIAACMLVRPSTEMLDAFGKEIRPHLS